ncbi:MAG: 1-deoxy-D-xylulose-5-phosphate synthase [Prevotellaceae bacterium]|jgi:1-deoxy-D-xylulose-5-phosphate synthase|nr:1-deoxy-D-xylulose-5-phosphate synthase [Prevotellaceae bacterium]
MVTLLHTINTPGDLRKLKLSELPEVCAELRNCIIDTCAENPGHIGASLGVVELTAALHYVFDTPHDKLIWDVGHQAYAHKILTGRREVFHTNRKYNGISGFPRRSESAYDPYGGGHSSVSISAALGMATAAKIQGIKQQTVAIIGDGALTGGLAFEGLNNAGAMQSNLLVVLNDNNISIDENVGALHHYLMKLTLSARYNRFKTKVWNVLGQNAVRRAIRSISATVKQVVFKRSNLFEAMGFRYFGPVDGYDLPYLVSVLKSLKEIDGPKLLHVVTTKGKGYKPAEENQTDWHAPGLFDKNTGQRIKVKGMPSRYQDVFGETIIELAEKNERIVGITPAMPTGCSLNLMMEQMPHRAFDVGIAEAHAVTFSAGLAAQGLLPFCNIYSSFMQRAFDSVIHDVAIQNLQVVFCLDRGGLVGEDGATHHGAYDMAYLRCIPNMIVSAPMNEVELRNLMYTAQLPGGGPFAIRYPRGSGVGLDWSRRPFEPVPLGTARKLRNGDHVVVLSIGAIGNEVSKALERLAAESVAIAHYDMRFVKPLDEKILHEAGRKYKHVVTVENGTVLGGLGSAVAEFFTANGYLLPVTRIGIPDCYIEQGTIAQLHAECGMDVEGIYSTCRKIGKLFGK